MLEPHYLAGVAKRFIRFQAFYAPNIFAVQFWLRRHKEGQIARVNFNDIFFGQFSYASLFPWILKAPRQLRISAVNELETISG